VPHGPERRGGYGVTPGFLREDTELTSFSTGSPSGGTVVETVVGDFPNAARTDTGR
jgi:hypothetical protein